MHPSFRVRTRSEEVDMTHHEHEPLARRRAAVMIGPMFEDVEAVYPYYRLQEAGATVELIGVEGGQTLKGKKGIELTTAQAAADLLPEDLDILVIAGGYGPDKLRTDDGVLALVRGMHEQGKPIAFICHAGWVPASAGVVGGPRVHPGPAGEAVPEPAAPAVVEVEPEEPAPPPPPPPELELVTVIVPFMPAWNWQK